MLVIEQLIIGYLLAGAYLRWQKNRKKRKIDNNIKW